MLILYDLKPRGKAGGQPLFQLSAKWHYVDKLGFHFCRFIRYNVICTVDT